MLKLSDLSRLELISYVHLLRIKIDMSNEAKNQVVILRNEDAELFLEAMQLQLESKGGNGF